MLKIRLRRMGARNAPFFRVVVSDSRQTPKASAVEEIGHYDPTREPSEAKIDAARVEHWVSNGARVSPAVAKLLRHQSAARPAEAAAPATAAAPAAPAVEAEQSA